MTSDPVNHRAAYICPRCREADRQRFIEAVMRCPGCDCDPVGYAPHNGKGDCPPKPADREFAQCSTCQGGPVCYCTDTGFPTTPQPEGRES